MNKKDVTLLSLLVVITLSFCAAALYQSTHSKNVRDAAVVKAQAAESKAKADASAYKLNLQAANTQVQSVTAAKLEVCSVVKAHKLTDPNCP